MRVSVLRILCALCMTLGGSMWARAADETVDESISCYANTVSNNAAIEADAADSITIGDGCDDCDDDCDCGPLWTIRGGAVVMRKESPARRTLFTNAAGTVELMNAGGFDYGSAGGVDFSAIRSLSNGRAVEVRYFGINDWSASQSVTATGNFITGGFRLVPFPLLLAEPAGLLGTSTTTLNATSETNLQNVEFNLRRNTNDWLTILGGVRVAEVNENLTATGVVVRQDFPAIPPIIPPINQPDQSVALGINCNNHLYGFQVGAEAKLIQRSIVSLEANAKIGIYYNRADVDAYYTRLGFPGIPDLTAVDRDDHVSFIGEMGVVGAVQLTQRLSARVGYQLLWIDGIAIASDQPTTLGNFTATPAINMGGTAFYHGATANLEYSF